MGYSRVYYFVLTPVILSYVEAGADIFNDNSNSEINIRCFNGDNFGYHSFNICQCYTIGEGAVTLLCLFFIQSPLNT